MKLSALRRYRKRSSRISTMLSSNPVLFILMDLPFVVVTATSLRNAAAICIAMACIHLVTMLVAWLIVSRVRLWLRALVTVVVSTCVMLLAREMVISLFPEVTTSLGMYLYLLSVNGMTLFQANFLDKKAKLGHVMGNALAGVLGFSLIMALVALFREYFGAGMIWGIPVPSALRLSGIRAPFFGFIMVGFLLAFFRYFNKRLAGFRIVEAARRDAIYGESGASKRDYL